jgi:hypothetical protein
MNQTPSSAALMQEFPLIVIAPQGACLWSSRGLFMGTLQDLQPSLKSVLIRGYRVETA